MGDAVAVPLKIRPDRIRFDGAHPPFRIRRAEGFGTKELFFAPECDLHHRMILLSVFQPIGRFAGPEKRPENRFSLQIYAAKSENTLFFG
jgi:hypothetical protein